MREQLCSSFLHFAILCFALLAAAQAPTDVPHNQTSGDCIDASGANMTATYYSPVCSWPGSKQDLDPAAYCASGRGVMPTCRNVDDLTVCQRVQSCFRQQIWTDNTCTSLTSPYFLRTTSTIPDCSSGAAGGSGCSGPTTNPDDPSLDLGVNGSQDPSECSPIIIDLGGRGFQLTDAANGVLFDIRADGEAAEDLMDCCRSRHRLPGARSQRKQRDR